MTQPSGRCDPRWRRWVRDVPSSLIGAIVLVALLPDPDPSALHQGVMVVIAVITIANLLVDVVIWCDRRRPTEHPRLR